MTTRIIRTEEFLMTPENLEGALRLVGASLGLVDATRTLVARWGLENNYTLIISRSKSTLDFHFVQLIRNDSLTALFFNEIKDSEITCISSYNPVF